MAAISGPVQPRRRDTGAKGPPATMLSGEIATNSSDGGAYFGSGNDGNGNATKIVCIGRGGKVSVADAAVAVSAYDADVQYTSITAARVATLPAANTVQPGSRIIIGDESGSVTSAISITIATNSNTDKINGAANGTVVIGAAYGQVMLRCDGASNWLVVSNSAASAPTGINGGTF